MNYLLYAIIADVVILFILSVTLLILLIKNKAQFSTQGQPSQRHCRTCGQILEQGWKRCPFCSDTQDSSSPSSPS
ncbi:MAG: hypothetical protein PHF84_03420 [bacterium]|nr:hypothetical protein [bacterium]